MKFAAIFNATTSILLRRSSRAPVFAVLPPTCPGSPPHVAAIGELIDMIFDCIAGTRWFAELGFVKPGNIRAPIFPIVNPLPAETIYNRNK